MKLALIMLVVGIGLTLWAFIDCPSWFMRGWLGIALLRAAGERIERASTEETPSKNEN